MNRSEKQQLIDELHSELEKSPTAVLLDFKGLSVPAATEFRRKVRASGSRYRVVKNSLALRAAKGTALERLEAKLEGTTGIAYTGDDPVALAKVLVDFAKDHPALSVKAGVVAGGQLLDAEGVKALSTMPGLPELRAKLLGLLMAPAQQLVSLLNEPATQTVRVLKAHGDKLEGGQ
jgi:large subunit ribosomal protein L10